MSDSNSKITPLNNKNYNEWKGDMQAWLMKCGYWRLVHGTEVKPLSNTEELAKWEMKAEKAAGEIYLAVEKDQKVHIRDHLEDPIKMWKELEKVHVSKNPGARFNAYNALFSIKKGEDESLKDLADRVATAMSSIVNLRSDNYTLEQLDQELEAMTLIRALPGEFKHLSSALLLQNKLDKDSVLELFTAEELAHKGEEEALNSAKTLLGDKKQYSQRGNSSGYGKSGGHRPRGNCYVCGKSGHWAGACPNRHKGGSANKAQVETEEVVESAGSASVFSLDEFSSNYADIVQWNTDTGATSHMTPHKSWIRNYTPYRVPIRLADNTVVYSEGVGSVVFSPIINGQEARDVEFARVLHVPALRNNLLSVLYLTKHKGFDVHIHKDTMEFILNSTVLFTASVTKNSVGYLNGHTVGNSSESVHVLSVLP